MAPGDSDHGASASSKGAVSADDECGRTPPNSSVSGSTAVAAAAGEINAPVCDGGGEWAREMPAEGDYKPHVSRQIA